MARITPGFHARGVKIIGLSVDRLNRHEERAKDIEETQGTAPDYPTISDAGVAVPKAYGMLEAEVEGDPLVRTPAGNRTVRNVFVIGPDRTLTLLLVYPMTTGRVSNGEATEISPDGWEEPTPCIRIVPQPG